MQVPRPVDRDADEELVLGQELAPFVVDEDAVGLEGVRDAFAVAVVLLELHGAPEEVHPHERRLAALPGEVDLGDVLRLDVSPDVGFQRFLVHAPGFSIVRVKLLLLQVEAVRAVDVAYGAGGLGHDVNGEGRIRHGGSWSRSLG